MEMLVSGNSQVLRTARHPSALKQAVSRVTVLVLAEHKVFIVLLAELAEKVTDRLERRRRRADLLDLGHVGRKRGRLNVCKRRVFRLAVSRHGDR